jgi:biopolymer transport protein ExbD
MKHLLEVCLLALTTTLLITNTKPIFTQDLQPGISVQLAKTDSGIPLPDADKNDSLVVTVADDGSAYVGIDPVNPVALTRSLSASSNRAEKQVYVKADARTSYAAVLRVLEATRAAGLRAATLLAAQEQPPRPPAPVTPRGLPVLIGEPSHASELTLQVVAGKQEPVLKINDGSVRRSALQDALKQLFQTRNQKLVSIEADSKLPFSRIVDTIDTCRLAGGDVLLVTAGR